MTPRTACSAQGPRWRRRWCRRRTAAMHIRDLAPLRGATIRSARPLSRRSSRGQRHRVIVDVVVGVGLLVAWPATSTRKRLITAHGKMNDAGSTRVRTSTPLRAASAPWPVHRQPGADEGIHRNDVVRQREVGPQPQSEHSAPQRHLVGEVVGLRCGDRERPTSCVEVVILDDDQLHRRPSRSECRPARWVGWCGLGHRRHPQDHRHEPAERATGTSPRDHPVDYHRRRSL